MKLIFSECSKINDRNDVVVKKRFVRSVMETASGGPPKIDFQWPDFTIENEDDDFIVITYETIMKIKKSLGAKFMTITG